MDSQSTGKRRGLLPYRICERTFAKVQSMYAAIRNSQPIGASSVYFEPGESRGQRLTANGIEFAVDVEHAVARALEGNELLQATWAKMALGEQVEPDLSTLVIQRCGAIFVRRGLMPDQYFRRNRYPEKKRV
jgi:hypothetical protein